MLLKSSGPGILPCKGWDARSVARTRATAYNSWRFASWVRRENCVADWIFEFIGVVEAAFVVGMLWLVARYDRDHPVKG